MWCQIQCQIVRLNVKLNARQTLFCRILLSVPLWVSVCSHANSLLHLSDNRMQQFLQKMYLSGWICVCFKENWAFAHYCFFSRLFLCVSHYWERECLDSRVRHSGWVLNINVGPAEELKKYLKVQIRFVQIEKYIFPRCKLNLSKLSKVFLIWGQQ